MKRIGTYYLHRADKIIQITKCEYYEDMFNPSFSIVTWVEERGTFEKTLIKKEQFREFIRIGNI